METACFPDTCSMSLHEILQMRESPVTEEQAWALCYQLCTLLNQNCMPTKKNEPGYGTPPSSRLQGVEAVVLASDGRIYVKEAVFDVKEEQVLDQLGRLIYICLDWGLDDEVERELGEELSNLIGRMINVSIFEDEPCQPLQTLSEALQMCVDRLDDHDQVAQHYRHVCACLFADSLNLHHLIQDYKSCRMNLQELLEPEAAHTNPLREEVCAWTSVMTELQQGHTLRPSNSWVTTQPRLPLVHQFSFDELKQDRKSTFDTLCKRQTELQRLTIEKTDPFENLLAAIRSRPKLRPVSERQLGEKAAVEPCLHEQLMMEIRSTDPQQLFASYKKKRSLQGKGPTTPLKLLDATGSTPVSGVKSPVGHLFEKRRMNTKMSPGFMSPLPRSRLFDLKESCRKRRAQSVGAFSDLKRPKKDRPYGLDPLTIAKVMTPQQTSTSAQSNIYESSPVHWQVCKCCLKRTQFFTWSNTCSRCNRVVCPDCGVKMLIPYKWCMELPLTFFRRIVLQPANDEALSPFWKVRLSWDHTKVPIVLESLALGSWSQHSLAMRGWHSQELCVQCQAFLEEAFDSAEASGRT